MTALRRPYDTAIIVVVLSLATTIGLFFLYLDQSEFLHGRLSRDQMFGRDFAAFWVASKLALADRVSEIYVPELFHQALPELTGQAIKLNPFPYPPHGLLYFLPLGLLPYGLSFATWMIGLWLAYVLVAMRGQGNAVPAIALLIAPSTALTVAMGQNGFLTALLFLGAMNLLRRSPIWAGVLFGLLTFKPQLGLLVPLALLAGGHWRTFISAALTAMALLGGSAVVLGVEVWQTYLSEAAPFQRLIMEQGTGAFMQMVPSPFIAARLLEWGVSVGYAVQGLFFLAAATGVVWAFRRSRDEILLTAALIIATFMASPYVFNYDMTLLSVCVIYLVQRGLRQGFVPAERWLLGFVWLLPILIMYLHAAFPVAPVLIAGLFAVVLVHVKRESTPDPA